MASTRRVIRILAGLVAITFAGASLLYVLLAFDLVVPPPSLPDTATLVDSLLARGDVMVQTWPIELGSSLLYALGFLALLLLARPLADAVTHGDGWPACSSSAWSSGRSASPGRSDQP